MGHWSKGPAIYNLFILQDPHVALIELKEQVLIIESVHAVQQTNFIYYELDKLYKPYKLYKQSGISLGWVLIDGTHASGILKNQEFANELNKGGVVTFGPCTYISVSPHLVEFTN